MTRTQRYKKQLEKLRCVKKSKEEYYWYLYFWHGRSGFKGFCLLTAIIGLTLVITILEVLT